MKLRFLSLLLAAFLVPSAPALAEPTEEPSSQLDYTPLYYSPNLADFRIVAECNPGGGTQCPCDQSDVALNTEGDYATVTSNPQGRKTWANAIAGRTFNEFLPDGALVDLESYRYQINMRLPQLPTTDVSQPENGNGVLQVMTLWDGRNALWESNKRSLEAGVYWVLNKWSPWYGKVLVYTRGLALVDTGITIPPDKQWHSMVLSVDFKTQRYISLEVDGEIADLSHVEVVQLYRPDWGDNVGVIITAESLSTWPQYYCPYAFSWDTQFSNADFGRLHR